MSLELTSETQQAITALDTLVKQNGALIEELQSLNALKDAHILQTSLDGYVFESLPENTLISAIQAIKTYNALNKLIGVHDTTATIIYGGGTFQYQTSLEYAIFDKLKDLRAVNTSSNAYFFNGCTSLKTIELPELLYIRGDRIFETITNLERLAIPNWIGNTSVGVAEDNVQRNYVQNLWYSSPTKLIDIEIGRNLTENFTKLNNWNPTEALRSDTNTLVKPTESFGSNLEKLLYNIREHIAANLPDRTGLSALTMTFSAAVKSAIQADTATANAFTNKNWTIA